MTTIACVLRSGGDFDARWVHALRKGVAEHLPTPPRFVCFSDVEIEGVDTIPLKHNWPGWWSKIEAFRFVSSDGPIFLFDLDTLPVGDLSTLTSYDGEFAMIEDLGRRRKRRRLQSGVVAFRGGAGSEARRLYEMFAAAPEQWMQEHRGDGEFLAAHVRSPDVLQDLYPGSIVSYKWECRHERPEGPALVLGHGQPRFSSPDALWGHRLWRERCQ